VPSVFISYSRQDKDFVERLHRALADRGYEVWVDWDDIPPSAEWFEEIRAGIASADGVVYVISPDSVVSEVCTRELEHAIEQHKRIVPVVYREPDAGSVPEAAAALNWVFLRDSDDSAAGIEVLVRALETDLEHVRTHTRLGVAAGRWEASGRDTSQLLRGAELAAAEAWLVGVGDKQPEPTQLQREYLLASRQAATHRQRAIIGGVSVALVVAIVLGVVALVQRSTAIHERDTATARFLDQAAQSNDASDPKLSVLLAVRAAHIVPSSSTEEVLRESLAQSHLRTTFSFPDATSAPDAVWSPDGTRLLVVSPGVSAKIYQPGTDAPEISLPPTSSNQQAVWDAKGDRLLIGGAHPAVYDAYTGSLIARIPRPAVRVALSSDGTLVVTTDPLSAVAHVFDVATGKQLASFHPPYNGGVTCIVWAPDDSVIAQCDAQSTTTSTAPGSLDLWDPRTGRLLHSDYSQHFIDSVAFSPDSQQYAYTTTDSTSSQSTAAIARANGAPGTFVYATRTGARVIAFPGSASAAAFSPVGSEVAYATVGDGLGHVYNFASGLNPPLVGATAAINSISFNSAGTYVVTASDDGMARVFDASTGSPVEQLADGDTGAVLTASFGLDDTAIATTSRDGKARLWTSPEPRPALQIPLSGGLAPAASVGFTSAGDRIVEAGMASQSPTSQGEVLGAQGLGLTAGFAPPRGYHFVAAGASQNGRLIAAFAFRLSGGELVDGVAETFDARTGKLLATMAPTTAGAALTDGTLNYAGDRFVTTQANGDAEQWDPRTGERLAILPGSGPAVLAAYSPDGSVLAIVHKPLVPPRLTLETKLGFVTIDLWNPRTDRLLRQIQVARLTPLIPGVNQFAPLSIAFSANSKLIALAGADTNVYAYATHTSAEVEPAAVPDGQVAVSLAFSPTDQMLAAGTAAGAYVLSLASSSWLPVFQHADPSQYSIENGGAVYVGFTRDSRILATVGDDALEAWDIADHLQLFHAFADRGGLNLEGTEFVAAAGDRLSVYPCELCGGLPQLVAVAKRYVTRGLTAEERATYLNPG
jgi:WD40 repeat protein